jgi:hypothetical protein
MHGKNIDATATRGGKASVIFKTKASLKCYIGNNVDSGHFLPLLKENLNFEMRFSGCYDHINILI